MTQGRGYMTTHVLDTAGGVPAAGVRIDLYAIGEGGRRHLRTATTNADGRTDEPLIPAGKLDSGVYELEFAIGDYFGHPPGKRFIDTVPVRFAIFDPDDHYHVPLLASPFSYSTYRGS